jgi:hypothetical protein
VKPFVPLSASAANYEGWEYISQSSSVIITGYTGKDKDVIIPSEIDGIKVEIIYANAFKGKNFTSVEIPYGVTHIQNSAFENCDALKSVSIPDSVVFIGASAFQGCTALKSVSIPDSVESIGKNVFRYCTALSDVTLGNGITVIPERAFADCKALESIKIPNSIERVDEWGFQSSGLKTIELPDSVETLGYYAFSNCSNLSVISIPASVTSLDVGAFLNTPGSQIFFVEEESKAEDYCKNNGFTYFNYEYDPTPLLNISNATIERTIFNGIIAGLTVKSGGQTLTEGEDYAISQYRDEKRGTVTYTITGKNGYTGTRTEVFGLYTVTTGSDRLLGDLNGDGLVDIVDVVIMKRAIAGWEGYGKYIN